MGVPVALPLVAVLELYQQPIGALAVLAVVPQAHQHPVALQLLACKCESQLALAQRPPGVAVRSPDAPRPCRAASPASPPAAQRPRSHSITVPPPYSPFGIVPSKSP